MTRRAFLTAEWRWLVMLNYEIDPAHLAPFLPRGTTLDLWQGRAMVSVVGFQFLNSAIAGLPLPFHQRFEEVNLRFYVRREAAGEVRRGVTFIRELVPHTVVALAARVAYNEPYTAVPMRSVVPPAIASEGRVEYAWKVRASWQHIAAEFQGAAEVPTADSEASFIAEHYWATAGRATARRSNTRSLTRPGASGPPPTPSSTAMSPDSTAPASSRPSRGRPPRRSWLKARRSPCTEPNGWKRRRDPEGRRHARPRANGVLAPGAQGRG
jgi:uncharacterized protein YqjF (DUF2071 family)